MNLSECKAEAMPVQEPELLQFIIRLEDRIRDAKDIRQQILMNIDKLKPVKIEGNIDQPSPEPGYLGHLFYLVREIESANIELRGIRNHLQEII